MRRACLFVVLLVGCREDKPAPKPAPSASASTAKPTLIPQNRTKAHDIESLVTAWNSAINAPNAARPPSAPNNRSTMNMTAAAATGIARSESRCRAIFQASRVQASASARRSVQRTLLRTCPRDIFFGSVSFGDGIAAH